MRSFKTKVFVAHGPEVFGDTYVSPPVVCIDGSLMGEGVEDRTVS